MIQPAELTAWIGERRAEMLDDLRAYVETETPSDDRAALEKGLAFVEQWLLDRLGSPARRELTPGGELGDVVVLDHPGTLGGPPVLLLAHYDTVWPLGTLDEIPFSVTGDVVRGPGVFDMKVGLVQVVWALLALDHFGVPRPDVRILLNGDEEIGSPVGRPVIEEAARTASEVLVLEASADGKVKTARKGVGLFQLHLTGVEAHAGLDPRAGASAVYALARVIGALEAAVDLEAGTSVNVGIVSGGTRANVTPGKAWASIDVRISSDAERERIDAVLASLDTGDGRVALEVTGGWNRPVMERTDAGVAAFERARSAATALGFALEETAVGGASDGNFAAAVGATVLDGLGAVGAGAHARSEHATVSGLLERTALLALLLAQPPR
ncbi:M20 family metallopeptidase [Kineococcus sp. SYSU DK003]|uniref:M20 family metallopeptidase n=1 Tax=Kineococcus sp. SYSU DK003 TaxID=3383124 RepID=UPI003D7CE05E